MGYISKKVAAYGQFVLVFIYRAIDFLNNIDQNSSTCSRLDKSTNMLTAMMIASCILKNK